MKFACVSTFICLLLFTAPLEKAKSEPMVDFESPIYTAGSGFDGVDGWKNFAGAYTVITPDLGGSGDITVLSGEQSGRISGNQALNKHRSIMGRLFDADGPGELATGMILSCLMQASGPTGATPGQSEFFLSQAPYAASSNAGIAAFMTGTFKLWGKTGPTTNGYVDSGVAFSPGVKYLLEMRLDLDSQTFDGFATDVTNSGPRKYLGTMPFWVNTTPEMYATSGFAIVTRNYAVGVFDDFDCVIPEPSTSTALIGLLLGMLAYARRKAA